MKKTNPKRNLEALKEIGFLEALHRRLPNDAEILKSLGDLYTKVGRYEDGLKVDVALSRLCPVEPLVWYNLACSLALLEVKDDALTALERAIDLGYRDYTWIREDTDLNSLKNDPRFCALLQKIPRHISG